MYSWLTLQLGTFQTCVDIITERGYKFEGLVQRGAKLMSRKAGEKYPWATLTKQDMTNLYNLWDLVVYDYDPDNDEPRFDSLGQRNVPPALVSLLE